MPLVGFVCLDGERVQVEDCLKGCRIGERCLTLPTVKLISQEREWNGIASTTQLINGTMLEWLKLTKPYYVDPDSRAFMLQGTKHHKALEVVARELGLPAEIPLSVDRDIFDLIEQEEDGYVLTDYKLWGSFRVAKALGIVETGKRPDPTGAVYKISGKWGKAGSPKMIPSFSQDCSKVDNWEAEFQLNNYQLMLRELGIPIRRMQLQITVRDGGLAVAKSRGIIKNVYLIPVPFLDEHLVRDFFKHKADCLAVALEKGWHIPCSPRESWDGRRCCKNYCDVWMFCPKGELVHSVGKEEE